MTSSWIVMTSPAMATVRSLTRWVTVWRVRGAHSGGRGLCTCVCVDRKAKVVSAHFVNCACALHYPPHPPLHQAQPLIRSPNTRSRWATPQVVDRIFEQAPRRFSPDLPPGKMGYEDFVWFILSEEDKTSDTALEYWFRCVDLDCSGVITPSKMWHFYEEQMKRLEATGQEPVLFEDVLCQLHDMLQVTCITI